MKPSVIVKLIVVAVFLVASLLLARNLEAQDFPKPDIHPPPSATERPNPCTLRIHVVDKDGMSHGTGAFIGQQLVVTAWHVVRDRKSDAVTVDFPAHEDVKGKVLAEDKAQDFAIIELEERFRMRHLSLKTDLVDGEALIVEGYNGGRDLSHFKRGEGTLSSKRYGGGGATWFKVEGYGARSGDSGGPVYSADGQFAGCLWGSVDGEVYFTPANIIVEFVLDNTPVDPVVPPHNTPVEPRIYQLH